MATALFGTFITPTLLTQLEGLNTSNATSGLPESLAGSVSDTSPSSLDRIPFIVHKSRRYTLESLVAKKGQKGRSSWIKDEGLFVRELLENQQLGKCYWMCRRCDKHREVSLFAAEATNSASSHLRKKHKVFEDSRNDGTTPITEPAKRNMKLSPAVSKAKALHIEELALGFIINSNQPFDVFNDPFLSQLLQQLDFGLHSQVAWSYDALRRRLMRVFVDSKVTIQKELKGAISSIHIAYDLWTSPNRLAFLGVSGHYLDCRGTQQQRLLALRHHRGVHAGINIAHTLSEVIRDWDIIGCIGTLVCDNATNNDTCNQEFFQQMMPSYTRQDIIERRLRCYGHILNLVGRAFLYGDDGERFEEEAEVLDTLHREEDSLHHWRKKGPIGKLHNVVKWVRASPQRSEYFQNLVNEAHEATGYRLYEESTAELQLILNNQTRWNSTYMMVDRAIKKQSDIQLFINLNRQEIDPKKRIADDDILTPEDWRLLVELRDMLEPVYLQTMRTQGWGKAGSHGHLWEVLTGMEYLLEKLEDWSAHYNEYDAEFILSQQVHPQENLRPRRRQRHSRIQELNRSSALNSLPEHVRINYVQPNTEPTDPSRAYFRHCINNGWRKLNEYYTKLDESPLYTAAVILNPRLGMHWLEAQWTTPEQIRWIAAAKRSLHRFWDQWYRNQIPMAAPTIQSGEFFELENLTRSSPTTHFDDWLRSRHPISIDEESELDRYFRLHIQPSDVADPALWWISQRETFPTVSKLALDILAIPAMAADCERAFSLAKLTLTSQRLAMSPGTLEQLECLKNWIHRGSISLGQPYFRRE